MRTNKQLVRSQITTENSKHNNKSHQTQTSENKTMLKAHKHQLGVGSGSRRAGRRPTEQSGAAELFWCWE